MRTSASEKKETVFEDNEVTTSRKERGRLRKKKNLLPSFDCTIEIER